MKKRILSIVLSIVMLVSLLPTAVLASGTGHEEHTCSDSCGHIDGDPHTTVAMSAWSDTGSLPNAGNYYLTVDVEISSTWTPTGNVSLCLNGKTITMSTANDTIQVNSGVTLTLTDCQSTAGNITHTSGVKRSGVKVNGGTFEMYGGSITGNTGGDSYGNGGGVGIAYSGTFNMYGGSITGNTATYGGGVYMSSGTFNMYGGTISGNTGSINGGGVRVNGGTFDLTGGSITTNTANIGGGVALNDGTFNLSGNPQITGSKNSNGNPIEDVYLGEGKTLTIAGALNNSTPISIRKHNNTGIFAAPGDGVTLTAADAGKFTSSNANYNVVFSDGKLVLVNPASHPICGAVCSHDTDSGQEGVQAKHENITWTAWESATSLPDTAGSYYLTADVTIGSTWKPVNGTFLCLNGHTITMTGSGDVIEAKNFTLTDCQTTQGEITHSSGASGDGVIVKNNGTFDMYGGNITGNNNSVNAGGVKVSYGTFNMYGGSITNNKAPSGYNGGGVYIDSSTTFNMYGGTISGNTASSGGGVYVRYNNGTFNMYGGTISGNTATIDGGGVYVFDTTSIFNISGSPVITGNTVGGKANNVYLPTSGVTITVNGALTGGNNSIGVKMAEPGVFAKPDGTNVTMLTAADAAKFTSDDADYKPAEAGNDLSLVPVHEHLNCGVANCTNATHNHSEVSEWIKLTKENISSYVTKSGSSYILTPGSYYLGEDITLSDVANDCTFIYMNASGTYNVCLNGNTITGSGSAPVFRANDANAVLNICDCSEPSTGKITGGYNQYGGGVCIDYGTVNLYGGSITGNSAYQQGAGVYVSSGTFNMYGGSITGNTFTSGSDRKGGGVYVSSGTFNMYDGTISDHVSSNGGGVYVYSGTFNMSGTAAISGNSASSQGGGVYVYSGTFTMTGGEITGNSANNYSGGVYNLAGKFNVSGSPVVTDNKVGTAENNIYCVNDITIIGALTADAQIGVNYYTETTFTSGWNTYMDVKEENIYEYFTPDDSSKYGIRETDGKLELYLLHEHGNWAYSYADGTITATCGEANCTLPNGKATYQLNVTENTKYSESYTCPISANGSWTGANAGTIVVTDNGLCNDLTNGLKGTATIKVNDTTVTTEATYTLQKADNAFTTAPAAIEGLTYTGEAQALITAGSATGGTVWYKLGNGQYTNDLSVIAATDADTYTVYYKVDGGEYYKDIGEASLSVTIGMATPTVTAPTAINRSYDGEKRELVTAGDANGGTIMYAVGSTDHPEQVPEEEEFWSTNIPKETNAGTYYVWYRVVGDANHMDTVANRVTVTIGKADINPSVSIDGWVYGQNANDPSVTGNPGNGTVTYYYKAQGADDDTYTTEVPSEVGNYTVKATIAETDNYNGGEATADFSITYANKTAADAFGYTYDAGVWVKEDPTFTPASGYNVSTEADGTYGSGGITFSDEGEGVTKTVYVKDSEGKVSQVELKYNLDKTTPVISAVSGNPTEWTKDNAEIGFTAADGLSGVDTVVVTCDDGENVTYDADSFTADRNDTYTITVTDKAGNVKTKTVVVEKIDKTAPDISAVAIDPAVPGDWYTSNTTVTVTATDSESGLAAAAYSFDGGTNWQTSNTKAYTEDGTYTVTVRVKDAVGNIAKRNPETIKIDTTAPSAVSVTAKVGEENYASGSDNLGDVVITLTGGEDALSGFDKFQYKIGEDSWEDIEGGTFTHSESTDENGVTYKFRAVDKAGNASGEVEFTVKKAFSVRFNANGGEGEMGNDTVYVNGAIVVPDCGFTREGYTFTGWNTAADGSGTEYLVGNEIRDIREAPGGGFDVYAQWEIITYNVTIDLNGSGAEGPADATYTVESDDITLSNPVRTGYTFKGWSGTGLEGDAKLTVTIPTGSTGDRTYTANWTANNYKVKFNADGGEGEMADQSFTYDAAQALTANTFTREGYKFVGWAESADATGVDYVDKQSVSNLTAAPNGQFTLYAVWTRDIILSGDIIAPRVSDAEGLEVVLVGLDGTEYAASVTGTASPYHYTVTVPEGEYQFVIKDTENSVTVTAKEELSEDKTEEPITMPAGNKNSIVVSTAAGDYAPIVGGIDTIAKNTEGSNVTVTLTVTHEESDDNDQEHSALMTEADAQKSKLTFLEIDLEKNVDTVISSITETDDVIEIIVPFDTTRKQNFKVYRFHDGTVDVLTTTANTDGEYIEIGTGSVTIHAKKFSLYAIGYTDVIPYYPVAHSCISKCEVCGGCEDAACTENACKDKCLLLGMNFTDVAEGMWYTEAVEYVYHRKMMEGVGNNIFDINGTTTRAMIVTILWRLEGEPVVNYLMQFEDVPAETWYTEAVRWAASEKIVEGYGDTFGPTDPITREQFATILWRYAKYKGYDVSVGEDTNILSYNDAFSVSEWAIPAMQWACGAGLMQGDGVNLTPKADATRAQAAALFQRFCENVAEK